MWRSHAKWIAVVSLCFGCVYAQADDKDKKAAVKVGAGRVSVEVSRDTKQEESTGIAERATKIQGMTVKNKANKEIGSVKDVVVDAQTGRVRYAALSYGGFLGLGDKLFAVPWTSFHYQFDAEDDERVLVLDLDEATLKNAPGFDQDRWPDFADPGITGAIDKYYGRSSVNHSGRTATTDAQVTADTPRGEVNVDVKVDRDRNTAIPSDEKAGKHNRSQRASEIIGRTVKNTAGKEIGSINDLVIDMDSGKLRYAAVSYGGFLGLGDKLFAVPWHSFQGKYDIDNEEHCLVLSIEEVKLRKAPGFDQDHWPSLADPKWSKDVDDYYGTDL